MLGAAMMGLMSQEPQSEKTDPLPEATVVEWGGDEPASRRRRWPSPARFDLSRLGAELAGDRRLVLLTIALGGVALFVSLFSEWQVTSVDGAIFGDTEVGNRPVEAGIVDLGGWGAGYLVGLFLLVGGIVLLLFGPPAGRLYGRLAALSTGGVLLAILVALAVELGEHSRLSSVMELTLSEDQYDVTYGRGVWCALVGVAAAMLGVHLAGRHLPPEPVATPVVAAPAASAAEPDGTPTDWPWRRPRTAVDDAEGLPDAPIGLTVSATTPFTPLGDTRDRPE
jgi:hypothetical protein